MSSDRQAIVRSLEIVAEIHGDPADLIYGALFAARPELEPLFGLDLDGGVRESMLFHTFECILDYAGPQLFAFNFIAASRIHHDGYGVPDHVFDEFFHVIKDTVKSLLGPEWTGTMEQAWTRMIEDFATRGR